MHRGTNHYDPSLMAGVFLHILADTLSSVGVTLAAVAIKYKVGTPSVPAAIDVAEECVPDRAGCWPMQHAPSLFLGSLSVVFSPFSRR